VLDGLVAACTALWATLAVYGGWLCLRELTLRELEKAPQQGEDAGVETSVDSAERQ
jgi:hypothetical protein